MTPQHAASVLELALPAEPDAVKRAFRAKARERHPDHGGTSEAFREITEARDVLLRNPKPEPANPFGNAWAWAYRQQQAYQQSCVYCGGSVFGHTFSCPLVLQQQQTYAQAEQLRRQREAQEFASWAAMARAAHEQARKWQAQEQAAAQPEPQHEPPRWWQNFVRWRKD